MTMDRITHHSSKSKEIVTTLYRPPTSKTLVLNLPISYRARTRCHDNGYNCIHIPLAPLNKKFTSLVKSDRILTGQKSFPSPSFSKINLFGET
ncbi:hypothetical protein CEXT_129841 [Caerostris extrusa]|uniref:Uncharacterized protein n=1 Tax=Caerostris extrusa TaxID=172846 RepID=A0AAV4NZ01_CAEEX|nr:hypothetical protein CEXT_129841 [Caerostris extrusa]